VLLEATGQALIECQAQAVALRHALVMLLGVGSPVGSAQLARLPDVDRDAVLQNVANCCQNAIATNAGRAFIDRLDSAESKVGELEAQLTKSERQLYAERMRAIGLAFEGVALRAHCDREYDKNLDLREHAANAQWDLRLARAQRDNAREIAAWLQMCWFAQAWIAIGSTAYIEQTETHLFDLEDLLKDFMAVAAESNGIAGYHLNGELMTWEEFGIDESRALLQKRSTAPVSTRTALAQLLSCIHWNKDTNGWQLLTDQLADALVAAEDALVPGYLGPTAARQRDGQ
jgi:hypothetical protein